MEDENLVLGYRALLSLEGVRSGDSAAEVTDRLFREWAADVAGVNLDGTWDGSTPHVVQVSPNQSVRLEAAVADDPRSGDVRRAYRLTDRNESGVFRTDVYLVDDASDSRGKPRVLFEGHMLAKDREEAMEQFGSPRIVQKLAAEHQVSLDGAAVSPFPILIGVNELPGLVDALLDSDRDVPLAISPVVDDRTKTAWLDIVGQVTRGSVGMARTYVLEDCAAERFNAMVPSHLGVGRGSIRTYLPKVDPDDEQDGLRHRTLGPDTITRGLAPGRDGSPRAKFFLQRAHRRGVRSSALAQPLPRSVRRSVALSRKKLEEQSRIARVEAAKQLRAVRRVEDVRDESVASGAHHDEIPTVGDGAGVLTSTIVKRSDVTDRVTSVGQLETSALQGQSARVKATSLWAKIADFFRHRGRIVADEDEVMAAVAEVHEALDQKTDEVDAVWDQYQADIGRAEKRIEKLEDEAERRRIAWDDLELVLAETQSDLDRQRRVAERRRKALVEVRRPDLIVDSVPTDEGWEPPETIDDLISKLDPNAANSSPASEYVRFSGDRTILEPFSRWDTLGTYAKKTWIFVEVLHDFALAKAEHGFEGNVYSYLTSDEIEGRKVSAHKYAHRESDSVRSNAAMRQERMLPVPAEVHPSGRVLMESHFKIASGDTFAPRMYFYDDTDKSGRIYLGYIGKHLTNTMT